MREIIRAGYRAFTKFIRWYGRIVTSLMAGLMAALTLCLLGGKLAGTNNSDQVIVLFIIPALLLWIFVSVISYRFLKPKPNERQ
jgi:hypothetical protein